MCSQRFTGSGQPATRPGPRPPWQRRTDTVEVLRTPALDGWVATASADGAPHLVPLSIVWANDQVIIAVDGGSRTARNLLASARARVGIGPTRDVVMIDVELDRAVEVGTDQALEEAYAAQADWDPSTGTGYLYLVLRPTRIQAWREAEETAGRTLMRDGSWSVSDPDVPAVRYT